MQKIVSDKSLCQIYAILGRNYARKVIMVELCLHLQIMPDLA